MAPHPRQRLGALAEDRAQAWYEARGYQLVARNWRCRAGEVDVVMARRGLLVVCEVKARTTDRFGTALDAVTPAKQARIRAVTRALLHDLDVRPRSVRFDVAAVRGTTVEVLEGAF